MQPVEVKFGKWIQGGFDLYKDNFLTLFLSTLIATALSTISLGILAGPMAVGLLLITLRLLDRSAPPPEIGDLFRGFDDFVQSFLFVLLWTVVLICVCTVLNLLPCIGQLVSIFTVLAAKTLLMFALFLIGERNADFWPASMDSVDKVKTNFIPFLALFTVSALIGAVGIIACGIGIFATAPLTICILTVAYRDTFDAPKSAAQTPREPELPTAPPEPGSGS